MGDEIMNGKMYAGHKPDYAVPPGATVEEFLEKSSTPFADFAYRLGVSLEYLEWLLSGEVQIDDDLAGRLGELTGIPAKMWHRLEQDYRKNLQ